MQLFRLWSSPPLFLGNVVLVGSLALVGFYLWMLTDCLGSRALPVGWKIVWALAIILLPIVGPMLYFLLAKGGTGSRPPF